MRNQTRPSASLLILPIVAVPLAACDATLPIRYALCQADLIPTAPQPTYEPSPDDPCLEILTSDPVDLPTYEQALAEAECDALQSTTCSLISEDSWQTGVGHNGELLYIANNGGFGGPTMYFDANTRRLIGVTTTSDAIDLTCMGTTYKIARIKCDDCVMIQSLCPLGPFSTLFR